MNGIVNINKPTGMTSHDVVNILRKVFHTKKVGHTGTLDPSATGVLPVCIGQATRVAEYLTALDKEYIATIQFGSATDTQDAEGEIVEEAALPSLSQEEFQAVCEGFLGEQIQIPPMFSAVKYKGKPLYKYAREGIVIEDLPERQIKVETIEVLSYDMKRASLRIKCSKGTYIRTLCADIAKKCGSLGHLIALERTQSGNFTLANAVDLEVLREMANPEEVLIPMEEALAEMPLVELDEAAYKKILNGMKISTDADEATIVQARFAGKIIAIGHIKDGFFQPKKVFKVSE